LRTKLNSNEVEAQGAVTYIDGIAKLRNGNPDLVILDYHLSRQGCYEVLKSKKASRNTVNIPVILTAQHIDQSKIISLLPYNVKKVFTKPVKIDVLLTTLSEMLNIKFEIDESPGIVEVHANENILFVEIAHGFNRDKLGMLKFKLMELIELCSIRVPKVIVMLSDMALSFADAPNLKMLLDVVMQAMNSKFENIRILTIDDFTRQFIEGHKEYREIEVVSNLQYAIDGLLSAAGGYSDNTIRKAEIIGDKVLALGTDAKGQAMQLRFDAETRPKMLDAEKIEEFLKDLNIAAVDDDDLSLVTIKYAFKKYNYDIKTYKSGEEFMETVGKVPCDLVFLDLMMPGVDGFDVINYLNGNNIPISIIVLSIISDRETILRVFRQGIKSYITKPFNPDAVIRKFLEVMRPQL